MVQFRVLETKGIYDFGAKSSEYKGNFMLGGAEVRILQDCAVARDVFFTLTCDLVHNRQYDEGV
jgi:hypothetical protein